MRVEAVEDAGHMAAIGEYVYERVSAAFIAYLKCVESLDYEYFK